MNKKKSILRLALVTLIANCAFAASPTKDKEPFDLNSIEYIEEEVSIDLGFDPSDYLPENFDPYKMYVDLNAIAYIEEEIEIPNLVGYLPKEFDAYAYPTDVLSINYIDENDEIKIDFDTKRHLPEGFNAYIK